MKNYPDEIKWLQKRMDDNPNSILFARLAERYLKNNEIDRAIQICDRGLEFHPDYSTGYFVLAQSFLQKEEFELAEKQLKKVLSINPNYLLAHKMFAELMSKLGWGKTAEASWKKILQIDPLETQVQLVSTDIQIEEQDDAEPVMPPSGTESELEINDDSIDNLFKTDMDTEETDEEIESLFSGTFEEDTDDSSGTDEQEKAVDKGLSDETVEALFESESDTSFESMVDEQNQARESETPVREEAEGQIADTTDEHDESEMGEPGGAMPETESDAFSLGQEDESVFGFAGDDEATVELDESKEEESLMSGAEEDAELAGFTGTTGLKDEDIETEGEIDESLSPDESETDFPEGESPDQENRYSNILDGIFSPGMDEEERKEMETRRQLEQQADEPETPFTGQDEDENEDIFTIPDDETETDEEPVEDSPELSPEDLIIKNAGEAEKISAQPEQDLQQQPSGEPEIPEGYLAFEEDDTEEDMESTPVHMQDFNQEDLDQDIDEEEEELGQFLAGLGEPDEDEEPVTGKELYKDILDEPTAEVEEQIETPQPEPEEQVIPELLTPERHEPEKVEEKSEEIPEQIAEPQEDKETKIEAEEPGIEPEPEQDSAPKDKFVTPTLGEIYAAQGQYAKAINVFELLQEKQPDNEYYKTKLEYLKKKLDEMNN